MFSSLLRTRPTNRRVRDRDVSGSPSGRYDRPRHATADFTEADDDDEDEETHEDERVEYEAADDDDQDDDDDEDNDGQAQPARHQGPLPVLPLFSSPHLGV